MIDLEIKPADYDVEQLQPGEAVAIDWDAARYHASVALVSRSMLETLRSGPTLYRRRYVTQDLPDTAATKARAFGSMFHLGVLEPSRWESALPPSLPRPANANGSARKGSAARIAYDQWKPLNVMYQKILAGDLSDEERLAWDQVNGGAGVVVVSRADYEKIGAMAKSIGEHVGATDLLAGDGHNELTIVWRDAETGILMRARLDRLRLLAGGAVAVIDLKSSQDPTPDQFSPALARYGYHRQGGVYVDAAKALFPDSEILYILITVRSSEPHEVGCYELAPDAIAEGRRQYQNLLRDLQERTKKNDWLADWQTGCDFIDLPRWAYTKDPT